MHALQLALDTGNEEVFNELESLLIDSDDEFLGLALDGILDSLMAETTRAMDGEPQDWACYALNLGLTRGRKDFKLDVDSLKQELSIYLDVLPHDIYIDPRHIATATAIQKTVLGAYQRAQLTKLRAKGVSFPFLESITASDVGADVSDERVVFFAVRKYEKNISRLHERLRSSTRCPPDLKVDQHGTRVIGIGKPWTACTYFLHEYEMRCFAEELGRILVKNPKTQVRPFCVVVQHDEGLYSLRISIVNARNQLLGGVYEFNLADPDVYTDKVDELLYSLELPRLFRMPRLFYASDADQDEAPSFWVPNKGWVPPSHN
ncbi:hypothetical protein LC612_30665 [Nostoc sp. CHAB 5834]|nr:hypothetical protein [Nostoc sp. CHAB 5834]